MSWFSDQDRARLRELADVLIPEAEGMPAASSVGAADALLDQVINLRADLAPDILAALRATASDEPAPALERLHATDPERFAALGLAIAAAYYMAPRVCELIGYHGPQRSSAAADIGEIEALLAPVRARGPIWRHPPV